MITPPFFLISSQPNLASSISDWYLAEASERVGDIERAT